MMLNFSNIKDIKWYNFSDNRFCKNFLFFKFNYIILCCCPLIITMIENTTSILGTNIITLPVERCWVVSGKKYSEQGFKISFIGIKSNLNSLGMSGSPTTNFSIGRIFYEPSGITGDY